MAGFKVGEIVLVVATSSTAEWWNKLHGEEVTILEIDESMFCYGISTPYKVSLPFQSPAGSPGEHWTWSAPNSIRKRPPKHQPDDLRVAEPQFINHQLPRWLGQPEKEKTLEKAD